MLKYITHIKYGLLAICIGQTGLTKAQDQFDRWPEGLSPKLIGKRVAENFEGMPHANYGKPEPPEKIFYPEVCTWYGALKFAAASGNKTLQQQLIGRFEPLFTTERKLVPVANHVDFSVFGGLPLEIYRQTKEQQYLDLGLGMANAQWSPPDDQVLTPQARKFKGEGYSWQTRLWIDDMFMINLLQMQAYRVTGKRTYADRAAKEMVLYLDSLQQPNGLFYHAPDVPFYWGRGNGWMAAGMTEILMSLPASHPDRPRILNGYRLMMAALLKYQAESGLWRQLVDDAGSWEETSGSAMFTYAMATGVRRGWLPAEPYKDATRKAWLALAANVNADGLLANVCEGTNKVNNRQHYLNRRRVSGDLHGQAAVLWAATALLN